MSAAGTLEGLLRLVGSPTAMAALVPELGVSAGVVCGSSIPARDAPSDPDGGERRWLARDGFGVLRSTADQRTCAGLVRGVEVLCQRELPASFIYAFDEPWVIGEQLRLRISTLLGREYLLVDDLWAWRIPPGSGGWAPHRGVSHRLLDRDAPEVLNVWVALTDVPAERACMHAVPLDEDPGYPDAIASIEAPLSSVRALPVSAGDALFWNANMLHWGGRCAERAAGPRVSCSFTLCRADAAEFSGPRVLPSLTALDLTARMDAVARMVLLYGDAERGDVRGVVREWATVTHELTARFRPPVDRRAP